MLAWVLESQNIWRKVSSVNCFDRHVVLPLWFSNFTFSHFDYNISWYSLLNLKLNWNHWRINWILLLVYLKMETRFITLHNFFNNRMWMDPFEWKAVTLRHYCFSCFAKLKGINIFMLPFALSFFHTVMHCICLTFTLLSVDFSQRLTSEGHHKSVSVVGGFGVSTICIYMYLKREYDQAKKTVNSKS